MLSFILGAGSIVLGSKAFTQNGLPLNKTKNLTGTKAKLIGVACILLGVFFLFDGVLSSMQLLSALNQAQRGPTVDLRLLRSAPPVLTPVPDPDPAIETRPAQTPDVPKAPEIPATPEVPQIPVPPPPSENIAPSFTAKEGHFQIAFPAKPQVSLTSADPRTDKVAGANYILGRRGRSYIVCYYRYSKEQTKKPKKLAAFRDSLSRSGTHGKLVSDVDMIIAGYPAKEFVFLQDANKAVRFRCFYTDFEMYNLGYSAAQDEMMSADAEQFFSSFRLFQEDTK